MTIPDMKMSPMTTSTDQGVSGRSGPAVYPSVPPGSGGGRQSMIGADGMEKRGRGAQVNEIPK